MTSSRSNVKGKGSSRGAGPSRFCDVWKVSFFDVDIRGFMPLADGKKQAGFIWMIGSICSICSLKVRDEYDRSGTVWRGAWCRCCTEICMNMI